MRQFFFFLILSIWGFCSSGPFYLIFLIFKSWVDFSLIYYILWRKGSKISLKERRQKGWEKDEMVVAVMFILYIPVVGDTGIVCVHV